MQSSVSIEGFNVPAGEGVRIVAGDEVPEAHDADRAALASYARAMDRVATMAGDPHFRWLDRVILDLHFDACVFRRDRSPDSGAPARATSGAQPADHRPTPAPTPTTFRRS